ncbi:pyocin knob domain-containing protein [Pseudomonas sp. IT-P291]|uniref:pyocin knob domain-containing protein n=1 Tax=Pseudomonas sp. IT-P291 TaxID=3026448 RepID=UPI0039E0BD33
MAKQTIALGTAPTGVGGDTPRSAFTKIQANFDELYAKFINYGFDTPIQLSSPALDSVNTFGFYYVSAATNTPPSDTYGFLLVQPLTTLYFTQTFTGANTGFVWSRTKINGTWTAWGRVVTSTNMLGTVSTAGGLPTGSIFQSGTNANGWYIRYADGTQMCWTATASLVPPIGVGSVSWTYPIAFITPPPYLSLTASVGNGADPRNYVGQPMYNNVYVGSAYFTTYTIGAVGCYAFAIGRWY